MMASCLRRLGIIEMISRNETLPQETSYQTIQIGLEQLLCIDIGGDPFYGTDFSDCLDLFSKDPATAGIISIDNIGSNGE